MHLFRKFVHGNTSAAIFIGVILLGVCTAIIVTNVVSRRFGHPLMGTYELVGLSMAFAVTTALSYAELKRTHVSISLIGARLVGKPKMILDALLSFGVIFSLVLLVWANTNTIIHNWGLGEDSVVLKLPITPIRIFFVYGLVSWCLMRILNSIEDIKGTGSK